MDFSTLQTLLQRHPAWRLVRSDHAPLVASFLERVFILPNQRLIAQSELAEALEDDLFALREQLGPEAFPKSALAYLNDWAHPEKAWLRKFYQAGSDEPQFDLTPATEKAISWLGSLAERQFVGTESRLMTLFALVREMSEGTETDPEARVEELKKKRAAIDQEISRIEGGDLSLLDDTALKDRFQQFNQLARELLGDFRQVEQNFRLLDRRVRERIARWEGGKGELLQEILNERDEISDSDEGKSFRAFWDFLMSPSRQEELRDRLERLLLLDPIQELNPSPRTSQIHNDWLEAGDHTQRTVAELSGQLRRFLDNQAWLENRRIMEILQSVESHALEIREAPPQGEFMELDESSVGVELPLERPLFLPGLKPSIDSEELESAPEEIEPEALFQQFVIDKSQLRRNIRQALQERSQISLQKLLEIFPIAQGLTELVAYLQIAAQDPGAYVDEAKQETIEVWTGTVSGERRLRQVRLPMVIFTRKLQNDG